MREFGTNEYGNKNGFKIVCQHCGKEARIVPISHINDNHKTEKLVLEIRCVCGNKYGADIL